MIWAIFWALCPASFVFVTKGILSFVRSHVPFHGSPQMPSSFNGWPLTQESTVKRKGIRKQKHWQITKPFHQTMNNTGVQACMCWCDPWYSKSWFWYPLGNTDGSVTVVSVQLHASLFTHSCFKIGSVSSDSVAVICEKRRQIIVYLASFMSIMTSFCLTEFMRCIVIITVLFTVQINAYAVSKMTLKSDFNRISNKMY